MMRIVTVVATILLVQTEQVLGYVLHSGPNSLHRRPVLNWPMQSLLSVTTRSSAGSLSRHASVDEDAEPSAPNVHSGDLSRRGALRFAVGNAAILSTGLFNTPKSTGAVTSGYVPAVRPTAYRVDSTEPPTLIPLSNARKQGKMLYDLGRGSGTDKDAILEDSINLNNILNKAVFGTIDKISGLVGGKEDDSRSGPGYASFVCMGVPAATTPTDIDLAMSLLGPIVDARDNNKDRNTALGLSFCPLSVQPALESYSKSGDEAALKVAVRESGVEENLVDMYMPLLRYARERSLQLLALSPEIQDIADARTQGLQAVNPERRQEYVADPQGFISLTQQPKYKLYTDRSLLKDFHPVGKDDKVTGFFAERILVHEAAATAAAKYAVDRPESLVVLVAPSPDLRYLQGINGRIPRIAAALSGGKSASKITNNAVTTILLNPTAQETLSLSRYLRLEIGTGPETLQYQTKVADYFWFSSSPKVNMIPRLMNG